MSKVSEFDLVVYEKAAQRYRQDFERRFPMPVKPDMSSFWGAGLVWWMILLLSASFLLSATRTGPVFYKIADGFVSPAVAYMEGFLAVLVVEGTAGAIAYFMVREEYRKTQKAPEVHAFMVVAVIVSSLLGLLANVYASLNANLLPEQLDITIAIFAGGIATLVLWLSGHILGVLYVRTLEDNAQALEDYHRDYDDWKAAREEEWADTRVQKKWVAMVEVSAGRNQTSAVSSSAVSVSNYQTSQTANALADMSTDRQTDRQMGFMSALSTDTPRQVRQTAPPLTQTQQAVWDYLMANPTHATMTARELAEAASVGKDTANAVKNLFNERYG